MNAAIDVAPLLDHGRWSPYQKALTALAALALVFDGFDIQILGFAIPSLMKELGAPRAAFGPILALGLAGMCVASPFAGYLGDRYGRRPCLIGSIALFSIGTLATSFVHSMGALAVLRFITGLGTGAALPNVGAYVAEFAPLRKRPVAVKLTLVCIPVGGMVCGWIASHVLPLFGWRALYQIGGGIPLLLTVALWAVLPESPRFLAQQKPRWTRLASLLRRMGHPVPEGSAFEDSAERKTSGTSSAGALFSSPYRRDTFGLWLAFLFSLGSIYLVFGWLPSMLASQGLDTGFASQGLAFYNFGGLIGVLSWAVLLTRFGSRGPLLYGAVAAGVAALLVLAVPVSPSSRGLMLAALALNGLFANAIQTALYAVAAHAYPTSIRATGIAYAAGIGRAGGILSSTLGAGLIGFGAGAYWGAIAACMTLVFAGIALVPHHFQRRVEQKAPEQSAA